MPPPLMEDAVEFPDGTDANVSQMAKDVVTFLAWAAEPENDDRKRMGLKTMVMLAGITLGTIYYKRFRWHNIKTRQSGWRK